MFHVFLWHTRSEDTTNFEKRPQGVSPDGALKLWPFTAPPELASRGPGIVLRKMESANAIYDTTITRMFLGVSS
jgi:hypothetical protein